MTLELHNTQNSANHLSRRTGNGKQLIHFFITIAGLVTNKHLMEKDGLSLTRDDVALIKDKLLLINYEQNLINKASFNKRWASIDNRKASERLNYRKELLKS